MTLAAALLRGSVRPRDNDSAWLLHPHRRGIPNRDRMRHHADDEEVDLCIVGAGAGGSVLAQRLARRGWRIVIIEFGALLGSGHGLGQR